MCPPLRLDQIGPLHRRVAVTLRLVGVALAEILDIQARRRLAAEVPVDLRVTEGPVWIARQHRQPPGPGADGLACDDLLKDVHLLRGALAGRRLQHGLRDRVIRPPGSGCEPLTSGHTLGVCRVR